MSIPPAKSPTYQCFIACAPGLEKLLGTELKSLGIDVFKTRRAGVDCKLELIQIYKICLWSRVANRVLLSLGEYQIQDEQTFYAAVQRIDWARHMTQSGTLAVDFFCSDSCITHSRYGAQLTKDAIVDWFRDTFGERPSVDRETPDIRVNVYLFRNKARISLDMSGASLHRRNYRSAGGQAPLKENLAASILLASRWSRSSGSLFDPMCGSATFLIEGAMIAGNIAPGMLRDYFGFLGWNQHDTETWTAVREEVTQQADMSAIPSISGCDIDRRTIDVARDNIDAAGLSDYIKVEVADFFSNDSVLPNGPGLVVVNPPYGERLENPDQIAKFYTTLGRTVKRRCANWQLALFTGAPSLFHRIGLSRRVVLECKNGDIDCRLFTASVPALARHNEYSAEKTGSPPVEEQSQVVNPWSNAEQTRSQRGHDRNESGGHEHGHTSAKDKPALAPGVNQFADRLRKNLRQIRGWAKSSGATNYRVYDADLPDYAFALDVYTDALQPDTSYVCLQEYRAPAHIDARLAQARIDSAAEVVKQELACGDNHLALKRRDRQRGDQQYNRLERLNEFYQVAEGEGRFLINIHDYLDCGLFLDHRKVRLWLAKSSAGKRLLNLYCYTASATVHAALGSAESSVSVDLSYKYLEWAEKNFALNKIDMNKHRLVRGDSKGWVDAHIKSGDAGFDIIFLDPPTFSNSSATEQDWDVQRDHESMIEQCMSILNPQGVLVFSNNFRRFKLAAKIPDRYAVEDRTKWSLQRDFSRNPKIHQCWFIKHQAFDAGVNKPDSKQ